MKVNVSGGFDDTKFGTREGERIQTFATKLAEQVIIQGHELRCGNLSSLDQLVIEAAADAAQQHSERSEEELVVSYVPAGHEMRSMRGTTNESASEDWDSMGGRRPNVPEPIEQADVVILIGGYGIESKTFTAANWAKHEGTPILPVATFGLAAREIYNDLPRNASTKKICGLEIEDLQKLSRAAGSLDTDKKIEDYAALVVSLAELASLSREVFLIMSFGNDDSLRDYRAAVKDVCERAGFNALRADSNAGASEQIIDKVHQHIENCGFVIADLTNERPNVYYEIGYARGLEKQLILTAKEGAEVHFDLQGYSVLRWSGTEQLKETIEPHVGAIASSFGLNVP